MFECCKLGRLLLEQLHLVNVAIEQERKLGVRDLQGLDLHIGQIDHERGLRRQQVTGQVALLHVHELGFLGVNQCCDAVLDVQSFLIEDVFLLFQSVVVIGQVGKDGFVFGNRAADRCVPPPDPSLPNVPELREPASG